MFLLPSAYFLRGGKSLFSSSAHFFKKLVCFCFIFLQNCINSLNILDINSVRYIICKYVLSLHRFFFFFIDDFLCCLRAFWFDIVQFLYFCFWCEIQKNHCQDLCQGTVILSLFSSSVLWFQVSHSSLIY